MQIAGAIVQLSETILQISGIILQLSGTIVPMQISGTAVFLSGTFVQISETIMQISGTNVQISRLIKQIIGTIEQISGTVMQISGIIKADIKSDCVHAREPCTWTVQSLWVGCGRKTIDVPRPLTNDLWVFLFQTIDAECVKWASLDRTYVYVKAFIINVN